MAKLQFSVTALVIKRTNVGELDRVVTLISQEKGKFAVIAKGARSLLSSRLSLLEPGMLITAYCVPTKSLPILTQAKAATTLPRDFNNLAQLKVLTQFLEFIDALFVEEEIDSALFAQILTLHKLAMVSPGSRDKIYQGMKEILFKLGYLDPNQPSDKTITEQVAEITQKKMVSFPYLTVHGPKGVK